MKIHPAIAAFVLTAMAISPAGAREVIFEAAVPQFACVEASDMADIKHIGELHALAPAEFTDAQMSQMAERKITDGKCFVIPAGMTGLADTEWQDQAISQDIFRIWLMKSGPFLYTAGNGWKPVSVTP